QHHVILREIGGCDILVVFHPSMASVCESILPFEPTKDPQSLIVRGYVPRRACRTDHQKWLQECIVDRTLQSVLLPEALLARIRQFPGPARFFEDHLGRGLDAQLLAVDANRGSVVRLPQYKAR